MDRIVIVPTEVLDLCATLLSRCGLSVAQLAQHTGQGAAAPANPAAAEPEPARGETGHQQAEKPPQKPRTTPRQAQALQVASEPGGTTVDELRQALGIKMQTAFQYLDTLAKKQLVTRVKRPGRGAARYFGRPNDALAYAQQGQPPAAPPCSEPALVAIGEPIKSLARKPGGQLPSIRGTEVRARANRAGAAADLPAHTPAHVQPLRVPAAVDTRYTVAPGERLTGGFSTTRPGVNPITGRAW